MVSTSLGNSESVFSSKPSLVELRRKARTTKGPRTKIRTNVIFPLRPHGSDAHTPRKACGTQMLPWKVLCCYPEESHCTRVILEMTHALVIHSFIPEDVHQVFNFCNTNSEGNRVMITSDGNTLHTYLKQSAQMVTLSIKHLVQFSTN